MKHTIIKFASVIIVSALMAGCGAKSSNLSTENPDSELSAYDLARLMDFHAWKVPIPQSQKPFKSIRLVIVKPDGTVAAEKFSSGPDFSSNSDSLSFILLGFRVEQGKFTGQFNVIDLKGGGVGYPLQFTDALADAAHSHHGV